MTFTYGDPQDSPRNAIRYLTGDTDPGQPLLHDEEIDFVLVHWQSYYEDNLMLLAAQAAEDIASKFAREIGVSADGQTFSGDALQEKYLRLAERLRTRANAAHPGVLYVSGMELGVGSPAFGTQMHDHPEAGQQDYGDYGDQNYYDNPRAIQWGEYTP